MTQVFQFCIDIQEENMFLCVGLGFILTAWYCWDAKRKNQILKRFSNMHVGFKGDRANACNIHLIQ